MDYLNTDDLISEWKEDCKWDEILLDQSSIRIPALHSKWVSHLTQLKKQLRLLKTMKSSHLTNSTLQGIRMKPKLKPHISKDEIEVFQEMHKEGWDISYISVKTGRSCNAIRRHLGLPRPEPLY